MLTVIPEEIPESRPMPFHVGPCDVGVDLPLGLQFQQASSSTRGERWSTEVHDPESGAVETALISGGPDGTMSAETAFLEEGKKDGPGAGEGDQGVLSEIGQGHRGGSEASLDRGGTGTDPSIRRNLYSDAGGFDRGVDPAFGQTPVKDFATESMIRPVSGSAAETERQTSIGYVIPSFVITRYTDGAWSDIFRDFSARAAEPQTIHAGWIRSSKCTF